MAKTKLVQALVTVRVPRNVTAHQVRRELMALVKHQSFNGSYFMNDRGDWVDIDETTLKLSSVKPLPKGSHHA